MLAVKREPTNSCSLDKHAAAVVKLNSTVVGHRLYNMALVISSILVRDNNKGSVEIHVTGKRVNRGAAWIQP